MSRKESEVQKHLRTRCPVCNEELDIVFYSTTNKGMEYVEQFVECAQCGYFRKYKDHNKKVKRS